MYVHTSKKEIGFYYRLISFFIKPYFYFMNKEALLHTEPQLIDTQRLLLRVYTAEAAQEVFNRLAVEDAMQIFGLQKSEDAARVRAVVFASDAYRSSMLFIIHDKITDAVIGACNFHIWMKKHARAEIGYAIDEQFRNQGITKEAMKQVLQYGFDEMGLNRVEAFIGPQNTPSLKLVAHFGFTREGLLREHYYKNDRFEDSVCFSLLKNEYNRVKHTW